jgi:hypothetical protein
MGTEELQDIIRKLDAENLKEQAFFGIFTKGPDQDECFIKANKEGLKLFALQLLRIANEHGIKTAPLDSQGGWISEDSDIFPLYVEVLDKKWVKMPVEESKSTLADSLIPVGCIGTLIFLFVAMLVGLVTIFDYFF